MQLLTLFLYFAVGCQEEQSKKQDVVEKPKAAQQKPTAAQQKPTNIKATPPQVKPIATEKSDAISAVKNIVTSIIKKDTLDIKITKLNTTDDAANKIRIEGDASDNATVSVLLKALEGNDNLQKVYLEKSDDNQQEENPRKVFSITAFHTLK